MSKSKKQDAFESISLKRKQLYKRSEKWLKEFWENSKSGESLIIWIIGANKILQMLMSMLLLYLYLDFGKTGLGLAWRKISDYLIQSGMDPIKADSMKNNGLNLMYSMGFALFIFAATSSICMWSMRRDNYSFKDSLVVRTTKFLFSSIMFILALGVVVFVFRDPKPLTVTVLWAIYILIAAKILNKAFLNFILNQAQKVMFHKEYRTMSYQGENEKSDGMTDENEPTENAFIDDDRLLLKMKKYFLVKESWENLIILENTTYSKNNKESFWLVEKSYRFRYTFFKFTRSLHIHLSVLDSLDKEDKENSPKPGDSNLKENVEEPLSKNIFISPRGTITSSETLIDRLKEKGYKVKILDLDAPMETFNPIVSLNQQIAEDYILEASINGIKTEKELEEFKESLKKYGITTINFDDFTLVDKFKLAKRIKQIDQERKWQEEQTLPTKKDELTNLKNEETDEEMAPYDE